MKSIVSMVFLIMTCSVSISFAQDAIPGPAQPSLNVSTTVSLSESGTKDDLAASQVKAPNVNAPAFQLFEDNQKRSQGMWAGNAPKFFQGAFIGFLGHEGGHVIANYSLGTDPYLKSVHYGPIPFFTIEPGRYLNNREHYVTASAGFNAQNIIDEWLLTKHPNLKDEDKPFLKGMASFNFWLNVGYAATAFAGTGPDERDTKGMADSLGWNERWVGAMILVPTALDTYRYKHPDAKWAVTASRLSKLVMIGLVVKADD